MGYYLFCMYEVFWVKYEVNALDQTKRLAKETRGQELEVENAKCVTPPQAAPHLAPNLSN